MRALPDQNTDSVNATQPSSGERQEDQSEMKTKNSSGAADESPRPALDRSVIEWVSQPARPLALGNPREYQSFGGSGMIAVFGAQSIEGKTVPLGARVKVTTEVLPPTREDVEAMLAICLPPSDAPVLTVHWNDQFPPHCHICDKRCTRDEEYYKHGGFSGHKRCAEKLREQALAATALNAPAVEGITT